MKEYTQTKIGLEGNCWQTAFACILEVDPSELPDQADIERCEIVDGHVKPKRSYNNALQAYLEKHHGLAYCELHAPIEIYSQLRAVDYHLMTGTTVRSDSLAGMRHVVVGCAGVPVWDPHPSRAFLLGEVRWAFLVPYPKEWVRYRTKPDPCECPRCKAA